MTGSGTGTPLVNVGDVLAGKYRIDRVLGVGGMGMVVAATHLELDQNVAIKLMLPTAIASATERFLREARAVVKLRGEHVCRVFDVGRLTDGAPYIVMELMDGLDLSQVLDKRHHVPVSEAVGLVLQALEGIAEAHVNGIVHRDLKPANLFIASASDGSALVKVLDFGISKSNVEGSATKTGEIMGSPSYMAPEQMQSSKSVDVRADVWAIGVILYEATCGSLPFASESLPALCMQVIFDPPPQLGGVPPGFARVVMRCLAKDPDERFADVGELAMALAPYGGDDASTATARIVKVLRRGKSGESTPGSRSLKTIMADEPTPAAISAPASIVRQSTLSGSASESLRITATNRSPDDGHDPNSSRLGRKLGLVVAGVATAMTLAIAGVVSISKRGPTTRATSAGGMAVQPAPATTLPPATVTSSPTTVTSSPTTVTSSPAAVTSSPTIVAPSPTTVTSSPSSVAATVTKPAPQAAPESAVPAPAPAQAGKKSGSHSVRASKAPVKAVTTTMPEAAPSPETRTGSNGKPIYKGTRGTIITTYPGE